MTETKRKQRRTTLAPVTTMEEIPVLDEGERAELVGSLEEAEADISAGKGAEFDPKSFKDRLVEIYRQQR
jgi:hypothetical protein